MAFTPSANLLVSQGFEQIALTTAAQTLAPALANNCHIAQILVTKGPGHYRTDGGIPVATSGNVLNDSDELSFNRAEAQQFSAILRSGATTCGLSVSYYRVRVDA